MEKPPTPAAPRQSLSPTSPYPQPVGSGEAQAPPVHCRVQARSIVAQAEACRDDGAIGALLRREVLYSSHLTTWRRQKAQGELDALAPKKRGRKSTVNPLAEENQRLRKENARLSRRLEQAELIIDVQKKVSALLGISLPEVKSGEENS